MSSVSAAHKPIPSLRGELPLLGSIKDFADDRLGFVVRLSREFPELGAFRLGPMRALFVNSARLAQSILATHEESFDGGKLIQNLVPLMGSNSLLLITGEHHRRQRKLQAPAFTPRSILEFAPSMASYAAQMVDGWADGAVVDLPEEMMKLTMRIVGKTVFDVDFAQDADKLSDAVTTLLEHVNYTTGSLLPLPLSWPTPRNARTRKALTLLDSRLKVMIEERRRGATGVDLLSTLVHHQEEDGDSLNNQQLRDHVTTLFTAGHETVANSMSWLCYLVEKHPEVYAALQQEVDTVLGGRLPGAEDLPKLSYTLKVIKEGLRLYSPAYIFVRSPVRDVEVEGYPMRKGDVVLISPYTLHRDETFFPEPEKFVPERFKPEEEKKRPRYSYMPFGAGPHVCIGNYFALMEAQLILSTMVQRVRLELMPGQKVVPDPGVTLRVSHYKMRVHRREAQAPSQALKAAQ